MLRCIGRGAYGSVWLARNVMGGYRAVKIVQREEFGQDRPFVREYEGLLYYEPVSRSHPNLMQILHVGRHENYFYYITELADDAAGLRTEGDREQDPGLGHPGPRARMENQGHHANAPEPGEGYVPWTLQEQLDRRGRLSVRECLSLGTALASALGHLHRHGLVHRDVKPSNVIFVHGVPKLGDIGLVSTVGASRSIVGTEGYLPPEGPGNPQADLFSLGRLLYEASTGMNRREYPRLPPQLDALADAGAMVEFNEILLKACARDTAQRYPSTGELLADLALLERGQSVQRLRRLERHHVLWKRVGAGLVAAALLFGAGWWQTWQAHRTANRHLVRLQVEAGTRYLGEGDHLAALPWLLGALQLDAGNPERAAVHRTRIANVLRQCALPSACYSVSGPKVVSADLNLEGTLLATAHADGWARVWATTSGTQVAQFQHRMPPLACQFFQPGDRLLTATVEQKSYVWNVDQPSAPPRTFPQAMDASGNLYSVGLNGMLGRIYLSKGQHRFVRTEPLNTKPEKLTLRLTLQGQKDLLRVTGEVRRTGSHEPPLFRAAFDDTLAEDRLEEGRDHPGAPIWGRIVVLLENASMGKSPADSGRCAWDNLRLRRQVSGTPPSAWQVLDDFESGTLTNWVYLQPPNEERGWSTAGGQLVLSCGRLPTSQTPGGCLMYLEPAEIKPGQTLEVEVDLVLVEAPFPMAGLSLWSCQPTPFTGPDRSFLAHDRWVFSTRTDAAGTLRDPRRSMQGEEPDVNPLRLGPAGDIADVDFSRDQAWAGVVDDQGDLSVWHFGTGIRVEIPGLPSRVNGARFSADSRYLAASHENGLDLFRTADWRLGRRLLSGTRCAQPRFGPREYRLAAVQDAREIMVWDLADAEEPPVCIRSQADIQKIAFSPDGRYLVLSTADGKVRMIDLPREEPFGSPLPGNLARFSHDGLQLMLFGLENGVWLWDLTAIRNERLPLPPPSEARTRVSSEDGHLEAELKNAGIAVRVYSERTTLAPPRPTALSRVALSREGRFLMAEGTDGQGWVWDTQARSLIAPPCPVTYDLEQGKGVNPAFPMDTRPLAVLANMTALLGGQRPDGMGGMIPIAEAARSEIMSQMQQAHLLGRGPDAGSRYWWHVARAEEAELAMEWESAVFHWERALAVPAAGNSERPEIAGEARLAYAREACAVQGQAIAKGSPRWSVILPRPSWATRRMLDLSAWYRAAPGHLDGAWAPRATFRELGSGVKTLGGVGFDVRGVIDLQADRRVVIPVGLPCRRLHLLGAASRRVFHRESAGRWQVGFSSGRAVEVPLVNPGDLAPCLAHPFHQASQRSRTNSVSGLHATLAWCGTVRGHGTHLEPAYLTRVTWELPAHAPEEAVDWITLEAGPGESAPIVLGITIE